MSFYPLHVIKNVAKIIIILLKNEHFMLFYSTFASCSCFGLEERRERNRDFPLSFRETSFFVSEKRFYFAP